MHYRTIAVAIDAQGALDLPDTLYGGVQGEHLATRLSFTVDPDWDGYAFYLIFRTATNKGIRSQVWTDLAFTYDIESRLTVPDSLAVHVFATKAIGDATQTIQLGRFVLQIDNCIETDDYLKDHSYDQMAGYESELAQLKERVAILEDLLDTP
jgi:hypothetical protein